MRIFITGGCGFIGSNMAAFHIEKGDEVLVIDNLSTGKAINIEHLQSNSKFKFVKADLLTWSDLEESIRWADRVYHFAAAVGVFYVLSNPVEVLRANIGGTARVLDALSNVENPPLSIIASSSSVYGYSDKSLLKEADPLMLAPSTNVYATYAASKLANESQSLAYYHEYGIPIILPRMFNVVGLRQTGRYGMVVPRFVEQACSEQPFTVYGDGTQTRSFCNVNDVVVALDKLAENPKSIAQIVNVGNNEEEIRINALAELVRSRAHSKSALQHIPYEEVYNKGWKEVTQRKPDLSKLYELTGFKAQWSLQDTVDFLIKNFQVVQ